MKNKMFHTKLCACGPKFAGYEKGMVISVKNKIFHTQICACGPKFAGYEKGMVIKMTQKKIIKQILICFLITFPILMLCSRSSFLYPYNNWDDANSYFSMGKSLFNGKVLYRDVFDQKGMYLYLIYGIAYLISHTTFLGVFCMELLFGTALAYSLYRIFRLAFSETLSYVGTALSMAMICSSVSFYWGGSAEEFMMPFFGFGLYLMLFWLKQNDNRPMKDRYVFLAGVLAGMVANIKFNSLGFFFAWMMFVFFFECAQKEIWTALKHCIVFLLGMGITFVPWILYFAYHHALYYWYEGYVYMNVFVYSDLNAEGPGLAERIKSLIKIAYYLYDLNPEYMYVLTLGILAWILSKKTTLKEKIAVPGMLGFLFLGIYIGGVELRYYSLPLAVFTIFGVMFLLYVLDSILKKIKIQKCAGKNCQREMGIGVSVMAAVCFCCLSSANIPYMKCDKEDVFLTEFKEIVSETEHPTLLNVGCFDAGLYTVCDIVPNCRWFQTQTLPIDEVMAEQDRYVREGLVDYVILRNYGPEHLKERYALVAEFEQHTPGTDAVYQLYKKVE